VKPDVNSAEVHPQTPIKVHPVDGVLVGAGLFLAGGRGIREILKLHNTRVH